MGCSHYSHGKINGETCQYVHQLHRNSQGNDNFEHFFCVRTKILHGDSIVRFVKGDSAIFAISRTIFTYQRIFLYYIEEKRQSSSNHPVSNRLPLFPDITLKPLHYQVVPPNLRKI